MIIGDKESMKEKKVGKYFNTVFCAGLNKEKL